MPRNSPSHATDRGGDGDHLDESNASREGDYPSKRQKSSKYSVRRHGVSTSSSQPNTRAPSSQIDLFPHLPKIGYASDKGSYQAWCPEESPMLEKADIDAVKLTLKENGLALPSYSAFPKIGYVLEGVGRCGMILQETTKEKVIPIKGGDALALPSGVVTWWFNSSGTELVVLFIGDTSKGQKGDFQITGSKGIFMGFTPDFVKRAWDLPAQLVSELLSNQPECCIVKVEDGRKMPEPCTEARQGIIVHCPDEPLDVDVKDRGRGP